MCNVSLDADPLLCVNIDVLSDIHQLTVPTGL